MKRQLLACALFAVALVVMGCGDSPSTMTNQPLGDQPPSPALGGGETAPNSGGTATPGTGEIPPVPGSVGAIDNLGASGCSQMDLQCLCERIVSLAESCYGRTSAEDWAYCTSNDLQRRFDHECRDLEISTADCWNLFEQVVTQCIGSSCGQCDIFSDAPTIDINFN